MQEDLQNQENKKKLVHIETYGTDMDAELAQTTLRAAGIDSIIMRDGADGMLQMLEYTEGIRLWVDEDKVDEAKAVLEQETSFDTEESSPSA
jgi:hypothetical protein